MIQNRGNSGGPGIYEALIDEFLRDALALRPDLRTVFGKIDPEEQPAKYASFVAKVLEQALREESDPDRRLALCNHILGHVANEPGRGHLDKHRLIADQKPILLEITPPHYGRSGIPRPHTSLTESSLFTGSPQEPQLGHELLEEMRSADGVDILVSFIKWSGLRLLLPAFEDLRDRQVPVRLITTSYMGASDAPAVEWLARLPNVEVRVSYDTERTRLHAKAYHFRRQSGYSTAYIGSANMSQAAITSGQLTFLFTVDKLSEGVDVPEINPVLFLRPTESLTVFLQQLGRGLRHAPEKDCLTVLDFVGQAHRRYRIDTKLKALLPRHRFAIDKEVEQDFPHLPAGCAIQLDRLSRQYVLDNIRENFGRLAVQVPDRLQTFTSETGQELNFGNFIRYHDYEPEVLLAKESWSEWKAKAQLAPIPVDPDLTRLKKALIRAAFINGPQEATLLRQMLATLAAGQVAEALALAGSSAMLLYYRIWGDRAEKVGIASLDEAFQRLAANPTVCADLDEILAWSLDTTEVAGIAPDLPYRVPLELHAQYGIREVQAAFGRATLESSGQTGVGVMHFAEKKTYALLVTFQKTEKEFSPSTMYADYPISRELMHWESQANTAQRHTDGQNLIHHQERGYTILVFARGQKKRNGVTVPFTYLGPVEMVSYESERPIKMVWRLRHPMPVEMFEDNRRGG